MRSFKKRLLHGDFQAFFWFRSAVALGTVLIIVKSSTYDPDNSHVLAGV